jgi:hypothetical protein
VFPDGQDAPHSLDVDEFDGDQEDHRGQGGVRQVGQRPGEQHQDDQHHREGGELGQLAAAAGAVRYLRFGRAAVDHERAGERGGGVRGGQAGQIGGLAERLLVLGGVGAGGGRALGQDDHEHRHRGAEQRRGVVPAEGRQSQAGQPARDGPDHGSAVAGQIRGPAHGDRGDHRDEQARDPAVDPADHDDDRDDGDRHRHVRPVHVREHADGVRELGQGLPARGGDPEHVGQLPDRYLDADAGQEADQHGAGQEVGQEAEPGQPGHEQHPGGQQGRQPGQPDVSLRAGHRQAGERGGEDGRGRGIRGHHEVAGRTEDGVRRHRQEHRVQAGDQGIPAILA